MSNAYEVLKQRGFVEQTTDEEAIANAMKKGSITCYAGFDPTASSLHVGHLLPVMAMAHMQRAGHRPIILIGGGTALIGDPSGKNEMRKILSEQQIADNVSKVRQQFSKYLDFSGENKALALNNADWLLSMKYVDFLRDTGKHFSVNRMIAAESYRARLETGLNFVEFNYMLLQAYDFLHLYRHYNCLVQFGGNDQWGNIIAGVDLTRKVTGGSAYGLTLPLITTASGAKMGKTEKGAVWLDPDKTSPYEFYQYWINSDDRDVGRFLAFFTFLSMEEIEGLLISGSDNIQELKQQLALEVTSITHGRKAAENARESAKSAFYGAGSNMDSISTTELSTDRLDKGIPAFVLFEETKLCSTRSEARRLIQEGGAYVNGKRVMDINEPVDTACLEDNRVLLRAGKKRFHRVVMVEKTFFDKSKKKS